MRRIALALVAALAWGDLAAAQEVNNVFFPAPREQRQRLSRAARALEEGSYAEAVVALGELLAGADDGELSPELQQQDFFLSGTGEAGTRASLKAEAQRMLGEMPEKGRDLYEVRFGPQARAQLTRAIEAGDSQLMMDITRRCHTEAGYEATMLLGRQYLGEGRPLAAAMNFQRLSRWPAARQRFDPQLSLLLATAWLQAGIEDKAQETLLALRQRQPDAGFRIAGQNVTLFSQASEALPWLRRWAKSEGMRRLDEAQWVMHRGNARRNATSQGDLPLLSHRWRTRVVFDPDDEQLISKAKRQKRNLNGSTISTLQLLAVRDTVLMRSPEKLLAVDFNNGKLVWEWPYRIGGDVHEPTSAKPEAPRTLELSQRIWEDASYGQMSSDGENIYFLNDTGIAGQQGSPRVVVAGAGIMRVNRGAPKTYNQLMSLSLRREGAIRWSVGGRSGGFEEELAGAFFLGPPLPMQGRLYALAELRGEIRLVVLNARDGRLIWQQQLAHLDNNTIARTPGRRLTGATPSFSDGVLVCPTGAGAVVALDISTRSLLWGYQYAANIRAMSVNASRQQQQPERWIDSAPTIVDNLVLLTPPESGELHCLDLLTGEEARWSPLPRDDLLYVAAAEDGVAMVVGKHKLHGIRLDDGQPAWDPVDLGDEQPSGFGFLSDGHYYLPTSNKEILKIRLATGKVAERVPTNAELGNLVCYKDNILSQSPEWVSSYYQRTPLRENVASRLADNPNDEWALARKCELLLQDGQKDEALEVLRRTHRLRPDDDVIRGLLVDTLLSLLRSDFDKHAALVDELGELIERPRERSEFAKLRAIGLARAGRVREAFQAAIELMPKGALDTSLEDVEDVLQVRRDRWVAARVAALTKVAEGADKEFIDRQVAERLEAALAEGTPSALRRFLQGFGGHRLARAARIELARDLIESGELLAAELQLEGVDQQQDALTGQAVALRAELLQKAGHLKAAAAQYQRLAEHWPQLDLDGSPASEVAAEAMQNPETKPHRWPVGQVEVKAGGGTARRISSYQRVYSVDLDTVYGAYEPGIQAVVDQRTNALVIRDGLGRTTQRLALTQGQRYYTSNYSLTRGTAVGHLMLITMGYELIAVDTLRSGGEGLLWRLPLYDALPGRTATINQIRPVQLIDPWGQSRMVAGDMSNRVLPLAGPSGRRGVVFQRMREMLCVDAVSGETIWSRQNLLPAAELLGGEDVVIVAPPEGGQATVLSVIDGRVLGKRPIEPLRSRWASWGRNTLAFRHEGNDVVLRLYDVWTGDEIWTGRYPRTSRGALVGGDEVAIMQADGQLEVLSLKDGSVSLKTTLQSEPQLAHLQVLRSSGQYIVVPSQPQTPESTGTVQPAPSGGYMQPMVNGRIYAFDRATGRPRWPAAATVQDYSLPPGQPSESPVLVLLRNERIREGSRLRPTYSALVLDRRDGRELHFAEKVTGSLTLFEVTAKPEENQVQLGLGSTTTLLQFTDDPAPPEPPAQRGHAGENAAENARNAVKRAADALFRNLVPVP